MPKLRGARTPTHSGSWYEENGKNPQQFYFGNYYQKLYLTMELHSLFVSSKRSIDPDSKLAQQCHC